MYSFIDSFVNVSKTKNNNRVLKVLILYYLITVFYLLTNTIKNKLFILPHSKNNKLLKKNIYIYICIYIYIYLKKKKD